MERQEQKQKLRICEQHTTTHLYYDKVHIVGDIAVIFQLILLNSISMSISQGSLKKQILDHVIVDARNTWHQSEYCKKSSKSLNSQSNRVTVPTKHSLSLAPSLGPTPPTEATPIITCLSALSVHGCQAGAWTGAGREALDRFRQQIMKAGLYVGEQVLICVNDLTTNVRSPLAVPHRDSDVCWWNAWNVICGP